MLYVVYVFVNMDKKKRSANFNNNEINTLMQCILPEVNVIENKRTDGATLRDKNSAWQRVWKSFNSANPNDVHRDLNSIKMKYDNIKKTLKRKITSNKENFRGTGGGPAVDIKLTWYEEQLYALLKMSIDGLPSVGDNDSHACRNDDMQILEKNSKELPDTPNCSYYIDSTLERVNINEPSSHQKSEGEITVDTNEEIIQIELCNNSEEYATLCEPSEPILLHCNESNRAQEQNLHSKTPTLSNKWNLKRKRTNMSTSEKKKLSLDSFDKLTEEKVKLTEIQKKCCDLDWKIKDEEFKINKEILLAELAIKQKTLEETTSDLEMKKQLHGIQIEKEKINLEIMKCELNIKLKKSLD